MKRLYFFKKETINYSPGYVPDSISIPSITHPTTKKPAVRINKMFHPIGLTRYHLCPAKPPKNNHKRIAISWRSASTAAGDVSTSAVSSSVRVTPSTAATAVLYTGNPA